MLPDGEAAGRDTTLKDKKLSVVVEINLERMHIHGKRVETFAERVFYFVRYEVFVVPYVRVLKNRGTH